MTDTAEVDVSGWDVTEPLLGDKLPVGPLGFGPPASEPLAEAAELCTPPARTELSEYMDETDIRFEPKSDSEGAARSEESGSEECFDSSAIFPGASLGVSESSTAKSSLLVLLLGLVPACLPGSRFVGFRMLYVEDVRDLVTEGGGIEMDAGSDSVSVTLGSAYRPFLEAVGEVEIEADRLCEAGLVDLGLSTGTGRLLFRLKLESAGCWRILVEGGSRREKEESTIPLVVSRALAQLACGKSQTVLCKQANHIKAGVVSQKKRNGCSGEAELARWISDGMREGNHRIALATMRGNKSGFLGCKPLSRMTCRAGSRQGQRDHRAAERHGNGRCATR